MINVERQRAEPAALRPSDHAPPAPPHHWVGLVANAYSGTGRGRRRLHDLLDSLHHHGLITRVAWTPEERHALVQAANSDAACLSVVAVGGDGTISALINEGLRVPLSVLPTGTENLFARHFRFRGDIPALTSALLAQHSRRVDLGRANGNLFALMAGFGFDADIVTRHHTARVGRNGHMRATHRGAYVEPILRASFGYRFPRLTVQIHDHGREETLTGTTVFFFNLPRYALGLPFAPDARDDDQLLDLVIFDRPGPFHALHYLWLVFRGLHLRRRGVTHRKIRRASVYANEPVPVQLDGDPAGTMTSTPGDPWIVEVVPAALTVATPVDSKLAHAR